MGGQKKRRHIPAMSHRNKTDQNGVMTVSAIGQTNNVPSKDMSNGGSFAKNAFIFLTGAVLMALLMPQIQNFIIVLRNNSSENNQISDQSEIPKAEKNFSKKEREVSKKGIETTDDKNKDISKELSDFNATFLTKITPKKIFVDGRRIPPVELLPQKPNNSSRLKTVGLCRAGKRNHEEELGRFGCAEIKEEILSDHDKMMGGVGVDGSNPN
ncbi:hypothetical protein CHS0354_017297 [Potamilus streckersoni]|uniref:Uncharacterized protein n=1 Tax=Potamilus streckersoni TaxID=2493646 RepID=A0AAE0W672_9BIVA|nr:hypothetical protein CHS0354_017297 [Potamilus streckersoni]